MAQYEEDKNLTVKQRAAKFADMAKRNGDINAKVITPTEVSKNISPEKSHNPELLEFQDIQSRKANTYRSKQQEISKLRQEQLEGGNEFKSQEVISSNIALIAQLKNQVQMNISLMREIEKTAPDTVDKLKDYNYEQQQQHHKNLVNQKVDAKVQELLVEHIQKQSIESTPSAYLYSAKTDGSQKAWQASQRTALYGNEIQSKIKNQQQENMELQAEATSRMNYYKENMPNTVYGSLEPPASLSNLVYDKDTNNDQIKEYNQRVCERNKNNESYRAEQAMSQAQNARLNPHQDAAQEKLQAPLIQSKQQDYNKKLYDQALSQVREKKNIMFTEQFLPKSGSTYANIRESVINARAKNNRSDYNR